MESKEGAADGQLTVLETAEEFKKIQVEAAEVYSFAETLVVSNEQQNAGASDLLARVSRAMKEAEKLEAFFTTPLKDQVKAIKARFAPRLQLLEQANTTLRGKISAYMRAREDARLREEARLRAQQEAEKRAARQLGATPSKTTLAPVALPVAPKTTKTEAGAVTGVKVWKFNVTNLDLVPAKYVKREVKTKSVLDDLKAGVTNIPGIEAWQDFETRVSA